MSTNVDTYQEVDMLTVGIRELKQQTSELVRMVREQGVEIQVSYHGKVVALLIPVQPMPVQEGKDNWVEIDHLAAEIGAHWPKDVSAVEAVREVRR